MKTVKTFARQFSFGLMMAVTLGSAVVSCDSILDEDDVDCSVEYRVKFKYDYNMKYADAFSREVSSVALYAFDDNGKLVYQKTEAGMSWQPMATRWRSTWSRAITTSLHGQV